MPVTTRSSRPPQGLLLLHLLPDHLLTYLLTEWVEVGTDLHTLVAKVLGNEELERLAVQPGFVLQATCPLSLAFRKWLEERGVRVHLLEELDENEYGRFWYRNGKRHRENDLPAAAWEDACQAWYRHGKCHRDGDRPAFLGADSDQVWYRHGKRHRDGDQSAFLGADGHQEWIKHGKLHRECDRPAVVGVDGYREVVA